MKQLPSSLLHGGYPSSTLNINIVAHFTYSSNDNRVAVSLVSDQNVALNPDIDTPFLNATDVIQRLLPWHVFQHPAEDIATLRSGNIGKGKRKATEEDLLREEIAGETIPRASHPYLLLTPKSAIQKLGLP